MIGLHCLQQLGSSSLQAQVSRDTRTERGNWPLACHVGRNCKLSFVNIHDPQAYVSSQLGQQSALLTVWMMTISLHFPMGTNCHRCW